MAWPLWERRETLRRLWRGLLLAALLGCIAASASALVLGWAMQVNADAGAYAGLALGMQVVLTSLLIPLVFKFV